MRNEKPLLCVFVSLVLVFSSSLYVQADVSLDIDQCYQEETQWCWAASSQAVLRFYRHDLTQTQIAQYGTEGANEWNWIWGESSDPTRRGIDMILSHFAGLSSTRLSQSLSATYSETLMLNRQMFFIRWGWDTGGGHILLPQAISGSIWTLMDPWYGPTVNSYAWVVSGGGHTWTHSLSVDTPAPLFPRGDIDASGTVTLADVIRAVQIASGDSSVGPVTIDADVDNDRRLGIAEAIFALQSVSQEPPPSTVTSAGQTWMDRNLGASRVATSMTDEQAYGDLYQWGRGTDGHEKRTSGTTSVLSSSDAPGHSSFITAPSSPYDWRTPENDDLWQGASGVNNPCPAGFRLPTMSEWDVERRSWSSNDRAGAYNSPLKLVPAGGRSDRDGSLLTVGSYARYWSSQRIINSYGSWSTYLYFSHDDARGYTNRRAYGASIRCIED